MPHARSSALFLRRPVALAALAALALPPVGASAQQAEAGKLTEITDSVFFRNLNATANNEANARGVFAAGNNNVNESALIDPMLAPIRAITRTGPITRGGRTLLPVATLDPRAANSATTSVATAPIDGFFSPVSYRGAFSPNGASWLWVKTCWSRSCRGTATTSKIRS